MTEHAPRDDISVDAVLRNSAAELHDLKRIAEEVDDAVGAWLTEGAPKKPPVAVLQRVDLLRQSIDCFATLFRNLAQLDIPAQTVPITALSAGVYLESVRAVCRRSRAEDTQE